MPFFGHKFTTFKYCKRKNLPFRSQKAISENLEEPIRIKLGSQESTFVDGEWKPGSNIELSQENKHLKEVSKKLEEENNFLRMKIEILIDMLTEESYKCELRRDDTL